jgi:hypothetical protein
MTRTFDPARARARTPVNIATVDVDHAARGCAFCFFADPGVPRADPELRVLDEATVLLADEVAGGGALLSSKMPSSGPATRSEGFVRPG